MKYMYKTLHKDSLTRPAFLTRLNELGREGFQLCEADQGVFVMKKEIGLMDPAPGTPEYIRLENL